MRELLLQLSLTSLRSAGISGIGVSNHKPVGLQLFTVQIDDRRKLGIVGTDPQFRNRYSANIQLSSPAVSSADYRNGVFAKR